jgi:2-dehydro-3-deoxy-D-arabinonate dehydratase
MKLCHFQTPSSRPAIGLVKGERVYDLGASPPGRFGSLSDLLCREDLHERMNWELRQAESAAGIPYADLDIPPEEGRAHLLAPMVSQEVWAAGVTYLRSREARMEESPDGGSFYDRVYRAERPELFFKATPNRVVGPNGFIRIRGDSQWNVPEPELALVINARGQLVAFTIGNDMSSRDIEGENPLYLPQAKVYRGCCALGPVLLLSSSIPDPRSLTIQIIIKRDEKVCFEGSTGIARMKRSFEELISFLFREQEFPEGVVLLTGTGIVPPDDFTLRHGDIVEITVPEIGTLRNPVF